MRMWYVIQVARGSEEAMAELIGRVAPADVLSECFYPQYETEIKLRGTWTRCAKPLFPGYLIAVTENPVALEEELVKLPEFARVLSMSEKPVPLAAEEVELIGGFTHPGERVVPMSQAVKDGEKVVVVAGPLLGHEGLIKEINRKGVTVLLIEQNANMALQIADVGYVMETGRITLKGSGKELLANEAVRKAYLGSHAK